MPGSPPTDDRCPYPAAYEPRSRRRYSVDHSLEGFHEVAEALRSPSLLAHIHDGTHAFREGTLRFIDGDAHRLRRKVLGRLLRGDGDDWFRDRVLLPTIRRNLDAVLRECDPDGTVRIDLVPFIRNAFFQLGASLIGLTDISTQEDADELRRFSMPINTAMTSGSRSGDQAAMIAAGVDARQRFWERYLEPALRARRKMVEQVEEGQLEPEQLPNDLLTIYLLGEDHLLSSDPDLLLREAVTDMINAGTFSSTFTLLHALDEILQWREAHPEDAMLVTDERFLEGAVAEAIRLHPVVPILYRVARDDVQLRSGRRILARQTVGIDLRPASRDPQVFGADADKFNPRRERIAHVYPYGLSFGTGRHICWGLPLVMGGAHSGSHVQMIKALFNEHVTLDPFDRPERSNDVDQLATWARFPVMLGAPPS